ncbi:HU family DNA-binding protein [bacterium]|nr:MAG: HU family DNA-binding protein [bacterium]
MNRGDVLSTVAAECDMPQAKVDAVLKAFEGAIARTLAQGGEVRIAGFGTFKTSERSARTSRNPRTGEPVEVPARTAARFIPGKGLKTAAEGAGTMPPAKEEKPVEEKPAKAAKADSKGGKKAAPKGEKSSSKKKK